MKRISVIAVLFVFAAVFAVSASAQAPAAAPKVAVINTTAFDGKEGITKYNNAMDSLEKEFQPVQTKLQGYATRLTALRGEIEKLQKPAGNVPIDNSALSAKAVEYENLGKQAKREEEDAKVNFERRQAQIMNPVLQDIGKAMQEYANQKGYDLILDVAKLDNAGLILAYNPAKVDVTKDFITFYNARPAGAATTGTTPPRQP